MGHEARFMLGLTRMILGKREPFVSSLNCDCVERAFFLFAVGSCEVSGSGLISLAATEAASRMAPLSPAVILDSKLDTRLWSLVALCGLEGGTTETGLTAVTTGG